MDNINESVLSSVLDSDISSKYLTFQVCGQHYGISISNVIEIVQIQPATELPDLPLYVKGIINLRGRVVPLIDVCLRFGKPESEYNDRTCIIIVDIDGVYTGLIVDAVEDVVDIEDGRISPPPSFSADTSAHYVTGIGKLGENIILILNSRLLFSDTDIGILAQAQ